MYSPKVKIVPQQKQIILGKINDQQVPVIGFRDTHYRTTWDAEYTDWHKLDHDPSGARTDWGMWVHTFNELVPRRFIINLIRNISRWLKAQGCQRNYVFQILQCLK